MNTLYMHYIHTYIDELSKLKEWIQHRQCCDEILETRNGKANSAFRRPDGFWQLKKPETAYQDTIIRIDNNGNGMVWYGKCEFIQRNVTKSLML